MKIFSAFSGIGGFESGIRTAAFLTHKEVEFVGHSEIDKYAVSVYERHFKGVKNYGDITKIDADNLPDFDCLVGGFPCQAFSIAGRRKGFADTRGTLFFELARILRAKQPRLFVFENVKGLTNHDGGRTFRTIIATIADLGYDCEWQLLNSKNHGVPQNRERIIIVGHLRGQPRPQVFPITGQGSAIDRAGNDEQQRPESHFIKTRHLSQNGRLISESTTLQATEIPHIIDSKRVTSRTGRGIVKQGYTGAIETRPGLMVATGISNRSREGQSVWEARRDNIAGTIQTAGGTGTIPHAIVDSSIRKLTPLECERLQAFPDNWTEYGADGQRMSDRQRYKMCGNAVTTSVIQSVFLKIFSEVS